MTASASWLTELRSLFDDAFAADWQTPVAGLNALYGGSGEGDLSVHVPGSPLWFIGDVEAIKQRAWVLAVSLNPHTPPADFYESGHAPEFYWDLWRKHNRVPEYWKETTFYGRLARVAAAALSEELPRDLDQKMDFATRRMVFTNLCPYASHSFALKSKTVAALIGSDRGFKTMDRINRLLIDSAQPAVVLANGVASMDWIEASYDGKLSWTESKYPSEHDPKKVPQKRLRHRQGVLDLEAGPVQVVGFPFLGGQSSHSAIVEVDQLCRRIRAGLSS